MFSFLLDLAPASLRYDCGKTYLFCNSAFLVSVCGTTPLATIALNIFKTSLITFPVKKTVLLALPEPLTS